MEGTWLKSHWYEVRQEVPLRWSRLTALDLETIQGRKHNLASAISRRYGLDINQAMHDVDEWTHDCSREKNDCFRS